LDLLLWFPAKKHFFSVSKVRPTVERRLNAAVRNRSRILKAPSECDGTVVQSGTDTRSRWHRYQSNPSIRPFPARSRRLRVSEVSWCRSARLDERYSNPSRGKPCAKYTRLNVAQMVLSEHIFAHSCSFVLFRAHLVPIYSVDSPQLRPSPCPVSRPNMVGAAGED
jgi:hypothetical protein